MKQAQPYLEFLTARHAALGGITELRIGRKVIGDTSTWLVYLGPEQVSQLILLLSPRPGGPAQRLPYRTHPRDGEALFWPTLNPVKPELGVGRLGVIERGGTATRTEDILAYTLFVIDVDPVRAVAGHSATDDEKRHALEGAEAIREWLLERGVRSLLGDSGNGYHLLVLLTPYRDDGIMRASLNAQALLQLLDARFSDAHRKVDTSLFTPNHLGKLFGSMAIKGEDTPERPHRRSSIDLSDIPPDIDLFAVLKDELEAFRASRLKPRVSLPVRTPPSRPREETGLERWREWRRDALDRLPLELVYGDLLTGRHGSAGWLECRDPSSPSGDRNPSASVAASTNDAERGAFHSFRTNETVSVFDFLIQQGRASDFQDAAARIADLSGVPLPAPTVPEPANVDAVLERFSHDWPEAKDESTQVNVIGAAMREALTLNTLARETVFQRVRAITGLPGRVISELRRDVEREAKQRARAAKASLRTPIPEPTPGRAVVDYVYNRDTVGELFEAVLEAIKPLDRFFAFEGDVAYIVPGRGPVEVTAQSLTGLLSSAFDLRFLRAEVQPNGEEALEFKRYDVLPFDLAQAFLHDPSVLGSLPVLNAYCRSPLFDLEWRFISTPGYHPESGIYYDGPTVQLEEASNDVIVNLLGSFWWKTPDDRVNYLGMLLTVLTLPHWSGQVPFVAVNGNKPGCGKTTLARLIGVVADGVAARTIGYTSDDVELEKQIATQIQEGERIIVLDNVKLKHGAIESPVLERAVTDSRPNFRRLGSNTTITRPQNDIIYCLTMNRMNLGSDLRRRSIPINLHIDKPAEEVPWQLSNPIRYALEHRLALIAWLAARIQAWVEAGRPTYPNPAKHSVSQAWSATIDAILRCSQHKGFLENQQVSAVEMDPDHEIMETIAATFAESSEGTAADWVERLEIARLDEKFIDGRGNRKSPRAKTTIIGLMFSEYEGNRWKLPGKTVTLTRRHETSDNKARYRFVAKEDHGPVPNDPA